jgi:hypothetical protein
VGTSTLEQLETVIASVDNGRRMALDEIASLWRGLVSASR